MAQRGTLKDEGAREDKKNNCRRAEQHKLTRFIVRMVVVVILSCHGRSPSEGLIPCYFFAAAAVLVLSQVILHLRIAGIPIPKNSNRSWHCEAQRG
jgi:hypothetical protein